MSHETSASAVQYMMDKGMMTPRNVRQFNGSIIFESDCSKKKYVLTNGVVESMRNWRMRKARMHRFQRTDSDLINEYIGKGG